MTRRSTILTAAAVALALTASAPDDDISPSADAVLAASPAGTVRFERNDGQTDGRVRFLHRGGGGVVFLTDDGTTTRLRDHALRMRFEGARGAPRVSGDGRLASYSNYFIGNDPALWRSRVPHYAAVHYDDVYPGIGVVYHGRNGSLEYDFEVAPGADPGVIALSFEGADSVRVDADGDLVLVAGDSEVRHGRPLVFQDGPDGRTLVDGRFVLDGATARFEVAAYDRSLALVIDPIITFSTLLGGASVDEGHTVAVDAAGNAYVGGSTASADFPNTPGLIHPTFQSSEAYVTKLDATNAVVYSTYLGGGGSDSVLGVAADAGGNAYVGGWTSAIDFPSVNPFQPIRGGSTQTEGFVSKIDPTGSALVYSSYIGGRTFDSVGVMLVDANGAAYALGFTSSSDFPTAGTPFQASYAGGFEDFFVAKIAPGGASLDYATFLGGSGRESLTGIAGVLGGFLDGSGRVHLVAGTSSTNFPTTTGAFQETHSGAGTDGVLAVLDANGSNLVFSTLIGGNDDDALHGGGFDANGNIWIAGQTLSTDMPVANAFQAQGAGDVELWVGRIDPTGSTLLDGSYFGGTGEELCRGAGVDAAGNLYVAGATESLDLPQVDPFQQAFGGANDALVLQLADDFSIGYSSYHGGSGGERPGSDTSNGLAVEASGAVLIAGTTGSSDFPLVGATGSPQGNDAYLTRIGPHVLPVLGEGTLYVVRGAFKINHAQHGKGRQKDSFLIKGCLNPAGANADPTGATVELTVDGTQIIPPTTLDAKGRGSSDRGVSPAVRVQFKPSNGQFLAQVKNADLRPALGDLNATANTTETLTVTLTVANAGLLTDAVSGDLAFSVKSKQGKSSRGAYSFGKSLSGTAVYKASRTQASEDKDGGHSLSLRTWLTPDGGGPIAPTGDVTITIGDASPIVLPAASIRTSGSGATTKYSYSRSLGAIAGLKKFTLDNRRKSVVLSTEALTGTGVPPAGASEPTAHTIDVTLRVETAGGTETYGSTIELLRSRPTKGRWKR